MLHTPKENLVRRIARQYNLHTFVETGTLYGEMIAAVEPDFRVLFSIELSPALFRGAQDRFLGHDKVHLIKGDSQIMLAKVIPQLEEATLFWLDAHYSGGVTAESKNPLFGELSCILNGPPLGHVILIDDLRLFGKDPDFPSVDELKAFIADRWPGWWVTALEEDDAFLICWGVKF